MALLQSIVAEFDRELARLHALRAIVAGLSRTPKSVARLIGSPTALAEQHIAEPIVHGSRESKVTREARAEAGKPRNKRTPRQKKTVQASRALAAVNPSGPVVFSPARLAEEKNRREKGREGATLADVAPATPDLDALARSMAAQWGTSPIQ